MAIMLSSILMLCIGVLCGYFLPYPDNMIISAFLGMIVGFLVNLLHSRSI